MAETASDVLARRLIRAARTATLATRLAESDGAPYASLVQAATDHQGAPLLLLSTLALHTRNLQADPRVALLFDGTAGLEEPLTGPRLSVLGRATITSHPAPRRRYLARHPGAAGYADFRDFAFYRIVVERAHLVAGFGRIEWVEAAQLFLPEANAALAKAESGILAHMNADHPDAIDLYANALLGAEGSGWSMCGIDPEGCDLRRAGRLLRLDFASPVTSAEQARAELVRLAQVARRPAPKSTPA